MFLLSFLFLFNFLLNFDFVTLFLNSLHYLVQSFLKYYYLIIFNFAINNHFRHHLLLVSNLSIFFLQFTNHLFIVFNFPTFIINIIRYYIINYFQNFHFIIFNLINTHYCQTNLSFINLNLTVRILLLTLNFQFIIVNFITNLYFENFFLRSNLLIIDFIIPHLFLYLLNFFLKIHYFIIHFTSTFIKKIINFLNFLLNLDLFCCFLYLHFILLNFITIILCFINWILDRPLIIIQFTLSPIHIINFIKCFLNFHFIIPQPITAIIILYFFGYL